MALDACLKFALSLSTEKLPVIWTRAAERMTPEERGVMTEAKPFGLHEGVVFTIENQNQSLTIFTVAGGEQFSPTEETVALLAAAAKRIHVAAMPLREAVNMMTIGASIVNNHVGLRLRQARKEAGHSQTEAGALIGVSFQQIQKYEKGQNRISAGTLYIFHRAYKKPISWFYEGLLTDPPVAQALRDTLKSTIDHTDAKTVEAIYTLLRV